MINLETQKKEMVMKGERDAYEFLRVKGNTLYAFNEEKSELITKNLDTGEEEKYAFNKNDTPGCIERSDEDHFIVIGVVSRDITEYDEKTKRARVMANVFSDSNAENIEIDTCGIKEGYLYCNNEDGDIIRVNCKTGEKKTLINLEDWMEKGFDPKSIEQCSVSYMTDYIAVDLRYVSEGLIWKEKEKKKLLIFDYDGNYVRTKNLS